MGDGDRYPVLGIVLYAEDNTGVTPPPRHAVQRIRLSSSEANGCARRVTYSMNALLDPDASDAERQASGAWLKGDGTRPAVFETADMPRGIRLAVQPAEKVPFKDGQLAAQVFDEGRYKAWYVVDPCPDPEPFSSKNEILPGHNGHPIPHKYPGRDLAQRQGLFPGVPGVSGLATWPKGRLVALQADGEGEFATVYIGPPGERLRVNAEVAPAGELRIAIRLWGSGEDLAGRTFAESDRLIGDSLAAPVSWMGEERIGHEGRPLMLRVRMKQAKLFGFEFLD